MLHHDHYLAFSRAPVSFTNELTFWRLILAGFRWVSLKLRPQQAHFYYWTAQIGHWSLELLLRIEVQERVVVSGTGGGVVPLKDGGVL